MVLWPTAIYLKKLAVPRLVRLGLKATQLTRLNARTTDFETRKGHDEFEKLKEIRMYRIDNETDYDEELDYWNQFKKEAQIEGIYEDGEKSLVIFMIEEIMNFKKCKEEPK